MFRALFRLVLVVVVLVAIVAIFTGYRFGTASRPVPADGAVGTTGTDREILDRDRMRQRGAEIGERTADAVDRAGDAVTDGTITARIKSKMALDERVRALAIDVDTRDGVVTLSGGVGSEAEHERALQLARETAGVRQVVDRLSRR